jgi:hypothetical protein
MLPTSKDNCSQAAAAASSRAVAITEGAISMPIVLPGATRRASPQVMVPGPQPTSSRRIPGRSSGSMNAAHSSAERLA